MISIQVRGADDVARLLRSVGPRAGEQLTRATVGAVATRVVREARKGMRFSGPYSTGNMRGATRKRRRRVRQGIIQEDVYVQKRAFYWRFYEYGQGGSPRRAMFGGALQDIRQHLGPMFRDLFMEKWIRRMQRQRAGVRRGR